MALAEVMITLVTFTFAMGAILSLLEGVLKQAPKDQERAIAIREAQAGLHRMTRELRQGYKVLDAQPKSMYVLIGRSTPPDIHVKYDCDIAYPGNTALRQCVRWQANVGSELPQNGVVVIDRIVSEVTFNYAPSPLNPTYAQVHLKVPQKGEGNVGFGKDLVLEDGLYLRNTDVTH